MVASFASIADVVAYAGAVECPLVRRELIPAAETVHAAWGAWALESVWCVLARILQPYAAAAAAAASIHERMQTPETTQSHGTLAARRSTR
jgi:hypothetical protein